ncbi:MAG TPA: LLM class flavin-dependent oxidoreductase [Myxococcota bacterium]|nr:LLM class flavin-dependent oxidoreductase [Myxococcota bacterium]
MRLGVLILPEERWASLSERWIAAERMGLDHAWTYDHLTWRGHKERSWFAAVPLLAAAAGVTSRIQLGTLVASPNFRHPVPFAKELMTLDDLSGGRFVAGLGSGGEGFDATALGQTAWSRRERADRFEEFVRMLDRILSAPATTQRGIHYAADEARSIPGCVARPRLPFAIAASGPRALRLAAELGQAWVAVDSRPTSAAQVRELDALCASAGRHPADVRRLVLVGHAVRPLESVESFREVEGRYREMGFTDLVVHWPRAEDPFRGRREVLEQVAQQRGARG